MSNSGDIITVLGPISPDQLGITLIHEHVFIDLTCNFVYPSEATRLGYVEAPVSMEILSLLRRNPFSVTLDNLRLFDETLAVDELTNFKREGGSGLVDCTVIGLKRDPLALRRVSRATGLHIIQGTGVYVEPSHPDWIARAEVSELADLFVKDISVGIDDTSVRAGIIGEIGTSGISKERTDYGKEGDITAEEEKVLRAAAKASLRTGASVSVHLDPRGQGAFTAIDILKDEGMGTDRMIMGHLDGNRDLQYHLAIAEMGAYIGYDGLGREYYADDIELAFGSDLERIELIKGVIAAGFQDRLVLSQDICMKMDLRAFGGVGYDHIVTSGMRMFDRAGIDENDVRKMLIDNPRRALTLGIPNTGSS